MLYVPCISANLNSEAPSVYNDLQRVLHDGLKESKPKLWRRINNDSGIMQTILMKANVDFTKNDINYDEECMMYCV